MNAPAPTIAEGTVPPRARRRPWVVALAVGLLVSAAAWAVLAHRERQGDVAEFGRIAATRGRVVADAIEVHRALLATVPGLFDATEPPTPESLASFYERLHEIRPGHVLVGWAPAVAGADLPAFVADHQRDRPSFHVRRWDPTAGFLAAPPQALHAPLAVVAPVVLSASLLGWDLAFEPALRAALEDARDAGELRAVPAFAHPRVLGEHELTGPAVALVQPVYVRIRPRASVAERRAALRGWAVVVLDPTLVIDHARSALEPEGIDILLFDVTEPTRPVFLGHTLSTLDDEGRRTCDLSHAQVVAGVHQATPLTIGGRRWEVLTWPAPSFLEARRPWLPWAALATGLVLTALLTQALRASLSREAAVRRAVGERTAALSVAFDDLRRENAVRRRAEAGLAEQTERLEVTLRSIGDAVLTADAAGRVDYMNPAAEALTGWTVAAARERALHEVLRFVDDRSRAPRPDIVDEMLHAEAATETAIPVVLVAVGGADRSVWPRWAPLADPAGRARGAVVALRDVTEARRAEQAVREREDMFRVLSAELPDAIFLLDPADPKVPFRIVHANEAAARMHGVPVERLLGTSVLALDDAATAAQGPARAQRLRAGETLTFEAVHRRADDTWFPVEVIAREIAWGGRRLVLSLDRDITERRRAEEERQRLEAQVQHAQRLESLGVLAGGIAHDFNNLLMGVLGNADLALLHLDAGSPAAARVEDVKRAGLRASDLTQQLLAYAGKGRFVVEPVDLNDVVRDMAKLLEVSTSRRVRLVLDFAPTLPPVEADVAQLRQVVMNLITNASEAVGDHEGVVTLRTAAEDVDAAWLGGAYGGAGLPPGPYVVMEVTDTGIGMDEATQRKIFEPFFTTKFTGRGLGLAALLGIVRGHHGAVRVTSAPGRGSNFRVVLPPYRGDRPVRRSAAAKPVDAVVRRGTVLVIDDDPTVLEVVSRMLAGVGYDVLFAAEGREGVEKFRAEKDRVRAVLLDMTMPGLSSEETLRQIRALRPDVKVLVISGFTQEDAMARFAGLGVVGFVQKPFERETLVARVASLLA